MVKPFQLGKGLSSLIPKRIINQPVIQPPEKVASFSSGVGEQIVQLPIERIRINPYQPRHYFDQESLQELVASIKQHGILQPLVASPQTADTWQLIAGERRLKAAQILGLKTVPVIIRQTSELEKLALSLIENIQRQNLNPLEEARAYQRLHNEFNLTQEAIAEQVGKSRSQIANTMRLLELPEAIQQALAGGKITLGHAKVILSLDDQREQEKFFKAVVEGGLTVKQTSWGVKRFKIKRTSGAVARETEYKVIADQLRSSLGTKVNIKQQGKTIKVEIEYYSVDELKTLVDKLS
ncbi:MAG: ParB/RepB/Spo0J family partition protein [Patescibacteria group bacterium]